MSMWRTSAYRSPCEVLREINDLFQGDTDKEKLVRKLLAEAENKAKNMSIELSRFRPDFYRIWDKNKNANADDERRRGNEYKYHKI